VLHAGRDIEDDRAPVDRLHLDLGAQGRLGRGDIDGRLEVVAPPGERPVRCDGDLDVEVPRRRTVLPGVAVALHPEAHTCIHARRYPDLHGLPGTPVPAAAAGLAPGFGHLPPPAAGGAGAHPDEAPEDRLAHLPHLAAAAAGRAGSKLLRLAPRTVAGGAGLDMVEADLLLGPERRLLERYAHLHEEVSPGTRTGALPAPAAEEGVEDIPEPGEIRAEPAGEPSTAGVRAPGCVAVGGVPHPVVLGAFLGIGEDTVGLVDALEPLLGSRLLADIGVVFSCQVPVGFLDLLIVGVARNTEGIIVAVRTHRPHSLTS